MNYLAHIFLSSHNPPLLVGNMMTDMIRKAEEKEVSPEVYRGILLHRDIDQFTDEHRIFRMHKKTLYPRFRKYSPVVLDIIYDYLLENNWQHLSKEGFKEFEYKTYNLLIENILEFPVRVQPIVRRMVEGQWLRQYRSKKGLQNVFDRLEAKIKFPQSFSEVSEILPKIEEEWTVEHLEFFREVQNRLSEKGWPILQSEGKY